MQNWHPWITRPNNDDQGHRHGTPATRLGVAQVTEVIVPFFLGKKKVVMKKV